MLQSGAPPPLELIEPCKSRCRECAGNITCLGAKPSDADDAVCLSCLVLQPRLPFGGLLKALRLAAGMGRDELARRSGFSASILSSLEQGTLFPWPEAVARLERELIEAPELWMRALEANQKEFHDIEGYSPQAFDSRPLVKRQIRERRGQRQFRKDLRQRYGTRCLVTGCAVLAVLEAAHIVPHRGENDNHAENGLLLRADIHTLFDLDLLGIQPEQLRVELHPDITKEYRDITGKSLNCASDRRPSHEALRLRYKRFRLRVKGEA